MDPWLENAVDQSLRMIFSELVLGSGAPAHENAAKYFENLTRSHQYVPYWWGSREGKVCRAQDRLRRSHAEFE